MGRRVKFNYVERLVDPLPGESGIQYLHEPVIVVRAIGPSGTPWLIQGLLDTGADETLLPMRFRDRQGVARGGRYTLKGAGGSPLVAWIGEVDLEMGSPRASYRWSARVGFTPRRDVAIWGRHGFLNYFTATFDGLRRSVSLRSNGSAPAPRFGD